MFKDDDVAPVKTAQHVFTTQLSGGEIVRNDRTGHIFFSINRRVHNNHRDPRAVAGGERGRNPLPVYGIEKYRGYAHVDELMDLVDLFLLIQRWIQCDQIIPLDFDFFLDRIVHGHEIRIVHGHIAGSKL